MEATLESFEELYGKYSNYLKRQIYDGKVLFDYYVPNWSMFRDDPLSLECRGIIFDLETGGVVSRPFAKFFNLGENELTSRERVEALVRQHGALLMPKLDGSLVQITSHKGELMVASRSSMSRETGYVRRAVEALVSGNSELVGYIHKFPDYTFLFEYLDPKNIIVIAHEEEKLVFLNARNKITGEYAFDKLPELPPVDKVSSREVGWEEFSSIIEELKHQNNFEGYVFYVPEVGFFKVKTPWYVDLHKILSDFTVKNVLEAWAKDGVDDLIATLNQYPSENSTKLIEKIKNIVAKAERDLFDALIIPAVNVVSGKVFPDRKSLALLLYPNDKNLGELNKVINGKIMAFYSQFGEVNEGIKGWLYQECKKVFAEKPGLIKSFCREIGLDDTGVLNSN